MDSSLAIWLVPTPETYSWFAEQIRELSGRFRTTDFDPHLTLHAGPENETASPAQILGDVIFSTNTKPLTLKVKGVGHSEKYTKCLFVELELTESLLCLAGMLKERLPSDYVLQPHVSLLYHSLRENDREALAREFVPPFQTVTFAAVRAVSGPADTETVADALRWELVEERSFL